MDYRCRNPAINNQRGCFQPITCFLSCVYSEKAKSVMKVKRYESLLMVAIGCGLILMVCYSLFTMSFQVQSFRTIDYLPPLGRKYLPLFIPLTELVFAYGILWGIKKKAWSISLCCFLLVVSCFRGMALLNPWDPNCDCKGLLCFAEDIQKSNLIALIANVIMISFLLIYLHCLKRMEKVQFKE